MGVDLSDPKVAAAAIGAAGVVFAAFLALITALIVNTITKRMKDRELFQKDRELFQNALQHLTGKTQNRSVGIAIIKNYAEKNNMKDVAATIFLAQMLHLHDKGYGRKEETALIGANPPDERKIEEFNFAVMDDTVKRWGIPPLGDRAVKIIDNLKY
jgi:hypothetical protein